MSDEEAKMRAMIRKELCCVLEKALAARNLLGPRGLGQCSSFYKQGNYLTKITQTEIYLRFKNYLVLFAGSNSYMVDVFICEMMLVRCYFC